MRGTLTHWPLDRLFKVWDDPREHDLQTMFYAIGDVLAGGKRVLLERFDAVDERGRPIQS